VHSSGTAARPSLLKTYISEIKDREIIRVTNILYRIKKLPLPVFRIDLKVADNDTLKVDQLLHTKNKIEFLRKHSLLRSSNRAKLTSMQVIFAVSPLTVSNVVTAIFPRNARKHHQIPRGALYAQDLGRLPVRTVLCTEIS
jgi:hypothetical protein